MRIELATLSLLLLGYLMAACSGSNTAALSEPDMRYGHRYEETEPDGYRTIRLDAPAQGHAFSFFPATFERIIIRQQQFSLGEDTISVEILVKGSFPDECMEMHSFDQTRAGNIITSTLHMRRDQSLVCEASRHPYRLYLMLEGGFVQGNYTLKLNDSAIPFTVHKRETGE